MFRKPDVAPVESTKGDFKDKLESKTNSNPIVDKIIDEIFQETERRSPSRYDKDAERLIKNYSKPLVTTACTVWGDLSVTQISADLAFEKLMKGYEILDNKQAPTKQQFERMCEMAKWDKKGLTLREFALFFASAGHPKIKTEVHNPIGPNIDLIYTGYYLNLNENDKARFAENIFSTRETRTRYMAAEGKFEPIFSIGFGGPELDEQFRLHTHCLALRVTLRPSEQAPDETAVLTIGDKGKPYFCSSTVDPKHFCIPYKLATNLSFLDEYLSDMKQMLICCSSKTPIPLESLIKARPSPRYKAPSSFSIGNIDKLKTDHPELFVPYESSISPPLMDNTADATAPSIERKRS